MSLEKLTRELGKAIQQDERYLAMEKAIENNNQDKELNDQMLQIQLIQKKYQDEVAKENPDNKLLESYDQQFRDVYAKIVDNPNMKAYQEARNAVDELMNYLTGILALCVNGEDADTCDPCKHDCNDECCNH